MTSEPQALATRAREDWALDLETVGDPHHEISGVCRERGWLDLFVNRKLEFLEASGTSETSHPKGYYQPGVLVLSQRGRVLYRWRSVPTHQNMGGATERPTATHVWSELERALDQPAGGADAELDAKPQLDSRAFPWPLFVSLLIANGWFVRPRGFRQQSDGPTAPRRLVYAVLRLIGFAALWVAAFVWLPVSIVVGALALWVAWIVPRIRFLNEQFQHVSTT